MFPLSNRVPNSDFQLYLRSKSVKNNNSCPVCREEFPEENSDSDIPVPDENFDEVKKVLDGDRSRVRQLKLEPGDLQIFKGRFTLHRVTKVEGKRPRYMCIPAYVLDPYRVNTPEHSKAIYGKVLPIHLSLIHISEPTRPY